jgi:hypothetical protein
MVPLADGTVLRYREGSFWPTVKGVKSRKKLAWKALFGSLDSMEKRRKL